MKTKLAESSIVPILSKMYLNIISFLDFSEKFQLTTTLYRVGPSPCSVTNSLVQTQKFFQIRPKLAASSSSITPVLSKLHLNNLSFLDLIRQGSQLCTKSNNRRKYRFDLNLSSTFRRRVFSLRIRIGTYISFKLQ